MAADQYLIGILKREEVDYGFLSPVRLAANNFYPILKEWGAEYITDIRPSGSFAKGTANRSGTDIDLFISLSASVPYTLKEIYDSLFKWLNDKGYAPRRQNVSIGIRFEGYTIDFVPAKQQGFFSQDHSLYIRRSNTWTKTNVQHHINYVIASSRNLEIRLIKLWRDQHGLDFTSFYLELSVILALKGINNGLASNVWAVFIYLRDHFQTTRIVDPANSNNIVSDEMINVDKSKIKDAAIRALAATNWGQIIK
jgi:hypothetical protein